MDIDMGNTPEVCPNCGYDDLDRESESLEEWLWKCHHCEWEAEGYVETVTFHFHPLKVVYKGDDITYRDPMLCPHMKTGDDSSAA